MGDEKLDVVRTISSTMLPQSRTSLIVPSKGEVADRGFREGFIDVLRFDDSDRDLVAGSELLMRPDGMHVARHELTADFEITFRISVWFTHPTQHRQEQSVFAGTRRD